MPRDGFRWALRSLEYRSAAYQQLAALDLMEGEPQGAMRNASQSLVFNELNLNSHKILAITHRLLKNQGKAREALEQLQEIDPLNHLALFEKHLLQPSSGSLEAFNQSFTSEMVGEEYLEIALFYKGLGLQEEAVKILEEAPDTPMVHFWLAWLGKEDKERSEKHLKQALEISPEYMFPHRVESLEVLQWADERAPSWITDYYAALILWHLGRETEAKELLLDWGDTPDFFPFYYARAHLAGIDSDPALTDMQRALEMEPDQWRIYRDLAGIYYQRGDKQVALQLAETAHGRFPGNYILELGLSKYLTALGKYQASLDILEKTKVLPFEGENTGQRLHVYNHLLLAFELYNNGEYKLALSHIDQSESHPENLGSGKPSFPDYRDQHRLRIMIYDLTGESEKSRESQKKIQEYTKRFGEKRGGSVFDQQFSTSIVQPF